MILKSMREIVICFSIVFDLVFVGNNFTFRINRHAIISFYSL